MLRAAQRAVLRLACLWASLAATAIVLAFVLALIDSKPHLFLNISKKTPGPRKSATFHPQIFLRNFLKEF